MSGWRRDGRRWTPIALWATYPVNKKNVSFSFSFSFVCASTNRARAGAGAGGIGRVALPTVAAAGVDAGAVGAGPGELPPCCFPLFLWLFILLVHTAQDFTTVM